MYILTKKLVPNCVIFKNKYIEKVVSVAVDCKSREIYGKSDSRKGKLKQQWFIKRRRRNI